MKIDEGGYEICVALPKAMILSKNFFPVFEFNKAIQKATTPISYII